MRKLLKRLFFQDFKPLLYSEHYNEGDAQICYHQETDQTISLVRQNGIPVTRAFRITHDTNILVYRKTKASMFDAGGNIYYRQTFFFLANIPLITSVNNVSLFIGSTFYGRGKGKKKKKSEFFGLFRMLRKPKSLFPHEK